MGRSKFPGKPSKHVNRTRVNVLPAVVNTTVAVDRSPTVVTVVDGDISKKDDGLPLHEPASVLNDPTKRAIVLRRNQGKRTSISAKHLPLKRVLLSSPLNTSIRLTRSKVKRRSVCASANIRKLGKPKLSSTPKSEVKKLVGKFVLPTRSVHSSRVIKPNKRFISFEQGEPRIVKKRIINKKQIPKSDKVVQNDCTKSEESTENPNTSPTQHNGKVVLRQARLQVNLKSPIGPDGPFTNNATTTSSPPGTVTCGVCGAVRFYRFVKQARKFNIYSCESCRKFISKLIQRSNSNNVNSNLNCHKGQGMCHVPPIVRSQQWKFNRIAYNARCPACWLKLCLRSFQMPLAVKTNLFQLLPKHMQADNTLFTSSLPLLTWQSAIEDETSPKTEEITLRQRPVRSKQTKKDPKLNLVSMVETKRQKIDLKGPRVKHVCRSASLVLGQPAATFPTDKKNDVSVEAVEVKTAEVKSEVVPEKVLSVTEKCDEPSKNVVAPSKVVAAAKVPAAEPPQLVLTAKKDKSKNGAIISMLPLEITKPSLNKKCKKISPQIDNPNLIDVDYWETYDPDEIVCGGFSIIASEPFPMQSICFLCGSAGKEILLHCCICCEPYHSYCLEHGPPSFVNSEEKYTWVCPKCTTCSACGESDRQKINCQKCHNAYHPSCFNTKWRTDDRPTVCSNCLRCKSCGTDNITKFVGNLALCLLCFKLRNKGNFCPVCQCCYDDNDFDTKMMECGKCNKWVHAKCEGLSDEQYQILSILPASVEYICCLCSSQTTPYWRKAVQTELRSCFNNILRLLSKNRKARDCLKLSPFKALTPTPKTLSSARRLEFVESDENSSSCDDNSLDSALEEVNKIFKNKIDFGDSFSNVMLNDSKIPMSPCIVDIRNKLNCNEYFSLRDFNEGMENALQSISCTELLDIYRSIVKKVFPWFDPTAKDSLEKTVCDTSLTTKSKDEIKFEVFDIHIPQKIDDTRVCSFCKGVGDGVPNKEARLLYCGQNIWVHANCALWSSEVYEEIDGSLQNVYAAVSRGRSIRCAHCKQKGASVGCCKKACYETYHFPCAIKANCVFIVDKTIYCKSHDVDNNLNVLSHPREFEIQRSVHIEVDVKKKRLCDVGKVNFMVGALSVVNLGKIVPAVSDHTDAIIPVGYICSRLFWSTTEPWKLIPYRITTTLFNAQSHIYVDKNFTVDHTLPKHVVDRKLKEVYLWQRDEKDRLDTVDFDDYEEPQNSGDILSPELTDAILEELPHDLLDGISVQDMLMSYEELMNMDFKNSEINCNDNISMNMNNDAAKIEEPEEKNTRELRRNKNEVFQKIEDKMKPRNQQKNGNLTWLQQLDNSPALKKRKVATRDNMFMQVLQVDGACDSSSSECGSPTHETEDLWSIEASEEPVTCEKCQCTYRTVASYKRHLETCDAMFTSESENENETMMVAVNENQEPQVIASYETYSSFQTTQNQTHAGIINTQSIVSESTKLQETSSGFYNYQPVKQIAQANIVNINQPVAINANAGSTALLNQFCVNQHNVCVNENVSLSQPNLISVDKTSIAISPSIISVDNSQVIDQIGGLMDMQQQPVTLQSVPFNSDVPPIINLGHQNQAITIESKVMPVVNIPQNQWTRQYQLPQNKIKTRPRIVVKKPAMQGNTIVLPQNSQSVLLQQFSSSNVLPFVDAYQQTPSQNVQYVTAIAPPQAQLVQIPDNNFLSLVSNVQPTMIIQQPRVDTNQLIVDSNGSMVWTTQPVQHVQPVYYGFETIVQNTVMQSQQFLPSTVPGVLTTNSSYSATTQVFQTSKLDPVLDGSFVIVNPNQLVSQPVQVPQIQSAIATQPISVNASNIQMQNARASWSQLDLQTSAPSQQPSSPMKQQQHAKPAQVLTTVTNVNNSSTNSITLPVAPFVHEQGIPTNIVTPIPKQVPAPNQGRPMSRVLPMPTIPTQNKKPERVLSVKEIKKEVVLNKLIKTNVELNKIAAIKTEVAANKDVNVTTNEAIPAITSTVVIKKEIDKVNTQVVVEKVEKIPTKAEPVISLLPTAATELGVNKTVCLETIVDKEVNKLVVPEINKLIDIVENKIAKIEDNVEVNTIVNKVKQKVINVVEDIVIKERSTISPVIQKIQIEELATEVKTEPPAPKIAKNIPEPTNVLKINKMQVISMKTLKPKASDNKENALNNEELPLSMATDETIAQEFCNQPHKPKKDNPANASIFYKIESADGVDYTATSLPQIWRKVFNEVQTARLTHNLPPLPDTALRTINDLDLLGLRSKGMRYLLEQLPEVAKCKLYNPVFHKAKENVKYEEDDDKEGTRRCVPYEFKREKYDMFGWLSSKHRTLEMYDLDALLKKNASTSLPMAMRFRSLRVISKYSVGVYRSEIHGRGLFSLRDIEAGEMVIEYAGEVIRSILTDKREKYYNSKGIGCYMFRIDDNLVVDATMKGNAARFINHSCDPNCYSKVVEILGCKHIIIFALRKIICGEELTYDYKFPFEEDKIPCTCGTRRCRKFLN